MPTLFAFLAAQDATSGALHLAAPAAATAAPAALIDGPTQKELLAERVTRRTGRRQQGLCGPPICGPAEITPKNAKQMRPVCIYRSTYAGATQSNPLVYRGVMYLTIDKTGRRAGRRHLPRALEG